MAFDPSMLTPAGAATPIPPEMLGMTQEQYQDIPVAQRPMQQVMQTPDGQQMFMRQSSDGRTYYETPRVGESAIRFEQGKDGQWEPSQFENGGWSQLGKNAYQDPRFMAFLAVAAGGAIASSYAGAGAAGTAGAAPGATGAAAAPGASGAGLGTASGVSAGEIAGAAGIPELGLVATPGTAAAATAGGVPASMLGGGTGALTLGSLASGANTASSIFDQPNNPADAAAYEQMTGGSGTNWLGQVADFAKNNPGLVGAGLGALAGAASGSVDLTKTDTSKTGLVDYALPAGQSYADMANQTAQGAYLGQGLGTNPYAGSNPYLGQAMDDVTKRMTDAYKDGTASQAMGQFAAGGAFGGSAQQQYMESQNRAFGDSLGQTLNNMSMQDYTQQQQLAENALQRQLSQFQSERNNMMQVGSGLGSLGSTGTQTSTVNGVGPVQGALSGAIGGWAMGQQASQPQYTGNQLGTQPITTNVQQPKNAFAYQPQQPNLNTRLYAQGY